MYPIHANCFVLLPLPFFSLYPSRPLTTVYFLFPSNTTPEHNRPRQVRRQTRHNNTTSNTPKQGTWRGGEAVSACVNLLRFGCSSSALADNCLGYFRKSTNFSEKKAASAGGLAQLFFFFGLHFFFEGRHVAKSRPCPRRTTAKSRGK